MARRLRLRGLIPQLLPELWHGVRPRNRTYLVATAYAARSTHDPTGNGLVSYTFATNRGLEDSKIAHNGKWLPPVTVKDSVRVLSSGPISASSKKLWYDLAGCIQVLNDKSILSTLRSWHDTMSATLSAVSSARYALITQACDKSSAHCPEIFRHWSLSGVLSGSNSLSGSESNSLFTLRIEPNMPKDSHKIGPTNRNSGVVQSRTFIELHMQPKASLLSASVDQFTNDAIQSVDDVARKLCSHLQDLLRGREFTSAVSWNEAAVTHLEESFRCSALEQYLGLESIGLFSTNDDISSRWSCLHEHNCSRSKSYGGSFDLLPTPFKRYHEVGPATTENSTAMSPVCNATRSETLVEPSKRAHANRNSRGFVQIPMHPYLVGISVAPHPSVACTPSTIAESFEEGRSRRTGTASDLPIVLDNFLAVLRSLPKDVTDPARFTISMDPAVVAEGSAGSVPRPLFTLELKKGPSSESVGISVTSDLQACFQLRFNDTKWKNRSIRVQRIVLQMSPIDGVAVDSLLGVPTDTQVRISTETNHLAASASATMRKVCEGVKFVDVTVVPGMLAEAVLRIVRPLTIGLMLERVSVSVIIGDDPVTLTKTVSLADLEVRVPSPQRYVRTLDHVGFPSGYRTSINHKTHTRSLPKNHASKIGFSSRSMEVITSSTADYQSINPCLGLITDIDSAMKTVRCADLYALQVFTDRALKRLPDGERADLYLSERVLSLPDLGKPDPVNKCHLQVSSDGEVVCKLHPITHVSVGFEDFLKGRLTPTLIHISLTGSPSQRVRAKCNARQQFTLMHEILASKLTAMIEGRVFRDVFDSADTIAKMVYEARSELSDHIVVDIVKVHVKLYQKEDETVPDLSEITNKHDFQPTDTIDSAGPIDGTEKDTFPDTSSGSHPGREHAAALEQLLRELDLKLSSITSTSPDHLEPCDRATLSAKSDSNGQNRGEMQRGVVIALGSNVGNRIEEIEKACRAIDADPDMRIVDTSLLYETKPMYVEDQESFVNGACEIETSLSPIQLLDRLQAIEQDHGRVKLIDKGPRNIDLDIVIFRDEVVDSDRLTIPHMLMHEREFVLRPAMDLYGMRNWRNPRTRIALTSMLGYTVAPERKGPPMREMTPLIADTTLYARDPRRATHIMSILNTTPDSFSDGGSNTLDTQSLRETAASHIAAGATIIDVGGQSSRPNAPDVTVEEEISRVLPAIAAIKSLPEAVKVSISVDTYRAAVAEAAVNAGAHIINDISAGMLDPQMLSTIARLGCTYVMMHMRGTPATMQSSENCTYSDDFRRDMRDELASRVELAVASGVRKWRIILDPGIGFAKDQAQNIRLLRKSFLYNGNNKDLKAEEKRLLGFPRLVGCSRKGFIGKITGVEEPKDRIWGTAVAVTASVAGGADIVRVHDVKEMAQVVKMADAIYRSVDGHD